MGRLLLFSIFCISFLNAELNEGTSYIKQKREVQQLKKDLNEFYKKKEDEYKKRQKELDELLKKIEKEKKEVSDLYEKNKLILKDIKGEVASKTSKIYNSMKPKVAAKIFNKMMDDGKVDEVFDIITRLKEKKVTSLMKFMNVKNASLLTQMLQNYQIENQ